MSLEVYSLLNPTILLFGLMVPGFLIRSIIKEHYRDFNILETFKTPQDYTWFCTFLESVAYGTIAFSLIFISYMYSLGAEFGKDVFLIPNIITLENLIVIAIFAIDRLSDHWNLEKHNLITSILLGAIILIASFAISYSISYVINKGILVKESPVSIQIRPNCSAGYHEIFILNRMDYPIIFMGYNIRGEMPSWMAEPVVLNKGEIEYMVLSFDGIKTNSILFYFDIGSVEIPFDCNKSVIASQDSPG